ncbi:PPE domain-containing protein [Mycolicibacterium sp. BiH015]|uniref:PPE domain-containing protein n=1 Tax=Mycolicibacterium sp. BiH015 TaxID=3018808 RepID=UPI0022E7F3C3|nr:PPE domain-containing protein [Mycolicibacterium sp. BiH015]MDA2893414.1 PPE domain-containing protein [Mycolicibacterium sp. BiH015]
MSTLNVDPEGLILVAQRIAEALANVIGGDPAHPPLGADPASTGGAVRLSTGATMLITSIAEQSLCLAATAAQLTNVSAGFVVQDLFNKTGLQKLGVPDVVTVTGWAPPSPPLMPDVRPPLMPPAALPGEALSAAVHSGSPHVGDQFIGAWMRVAATLDEAADTVRSASASLPDAWDSEVSTDVVRAHLTRYAESFDASSEWARGLVQQADRHAASAVQARADIPTPEEYEALRRQIEQVAAANAASGGMYAVQLGELYARKAEMDAKAAQGYGSYHTATEASTGTAGGPGAAPEMPGAPGVPGDPTGKAGEQMTPEKAGEMASKLPEMMSQMLGAIGGAVGGMFGSVGKMPEMAGQMVGQLSQQLGGMMKSGLDANQAERVRALSKAGDPGGLGTDGLGSGGAGAGGAGTLPAGGGAVNLPPSTTPTTGPPPNLPTTPGGGSLPPPAPAGTPGGMGGGMPMMPMHGMGGAGGQGGAGQEPPQRTKKVVQTPDPHTESVTGKVAEDRIAQSATAPAPRNEPPDNDDGPLKPVVRRITMPTRDDDK